MALPERIRVFNEHLIELLEGENGENVGMQASEEESWENYETNIGFIKDKNSQIQSSKIRRIKITTNLGIAMWNCRTPEI